MWLHENDRAWLDASVLRIWYANQINDEKRAITCYKQSRYSTQCILVDIGRIRVRLSNNFWRRRKGLIMQKIEGPVMSIKLWSKSWAWRKSASTPSDVQVMTLNCIHIFIVTGSFLYWCVMRPASQRFFIHSCINLQILIISYLATFLGTNSLSVQMCRKAVNQSIIKYYYV